MERRRGGQTRTSTPARNRLVVLLDDKEMAQVDRYVTKHGRDRSHWVRLALERLGVLKARQVTEA